MRAIGHRQSASPTWLPTIVLVVVAVGAGCANGRWAWAVYALSFWHYYVYALAFVVRAVPPTVFKRDALLLKSVSLAAFASVYLTAMPDPLSLLVVVAGFLLNITAAAALGSDRTYYGHELANLPVKRIVAFPYSLTAHPMLLGNMMAFGGTLLDAAFRAGWWPLAVAHVLLNLALLGMEVLAKPRRPGMRVDAIQRLGLSYPQAGYGLLWTGALLAFLTGGEPALAVIGILLCVLAHAVILLGSYTRPITRSECRPPIVEEERHHV